MYVQAFKKKGQCMVYKSHLKTVRTQQLYICQTKHTDYEEQFNSNTTFLYNYRQKYEISMQHW